MKQTLKILKTFGVIAGSVATVWAVFTMYDSIRDQNDDTQEMVIDLWEQQLLFEGEVTGRLDDLTDTVERIEGKIDNNAVGIYTNRRIMEYEREHRDEFSKDQMNEILDELKKNTEATVLIEF